MKSQTIRFLEIIFGLASIFSLIMLLSDFDQHSMTQRMIWTALFVACCAVAASLLFPRVRQALLGIVIGFAVGAALTPQLTVSNQERSAQMDNLPTTKLQQAAMFFPTSPPSGGVSWYGEIRNASFTLRLGRNPTGSALVELIDSVGTSIPLPLQSNLLCAQFSDSDLLVACDNRGRVYVFDCRLRRLSEARWHDDRAIGTDSGTCNAVSVSNDGNFLASGDTENLRLWRIHNGEEHSRPVLEPLGKLKTNAHYLEFSNDMKSIEVRDDLDNSISVPIRDLMPRSKSAGVERRKPIRLLGYEAPAAQPQMSVPTRAA